MGLKDLACLYRACFCQAVAQKAIDASIFNYWLSKKVTRCSPPAPLFAIFRTSGLLSLHESEIRAGKLLVDPGHLQEELVGGRTHQRYRKARRRHPGVDRALRKNTHIADEHAKILPEASVSVK